MGSKTNLCETASLELMFNNADFANVGDTPGLQASATPGSLFIALFTAAPGEAGGGTEATFGAYARVAVARTAGGWTISGDTVTNAVLVTFTEATSGSETVTDFAIMTAITGGDMLYFTTLGTDRLVNTGVTVEFAIGALVVTSD